jgi:hypothetical protein
MKKIIPILMFVLLPFSALALTASPTTDTRNQVVSVGGWCSDWPQTTMDFNGNSSIAFFAPAGDIRGYMHCGTHGGGLGGNSTSGNYSPHNVNPMEGSIIGGNAIAGTWHVIQFSVNDPTCGTYTSCLSNPNFVASAPITMIDNGVALFKSGLSGMQMLAALGSAPYSLFQSIFPYLTFSAGVFVAFYVVQQITMFLGQKVGKKKKK